MLGAVVGLSYAAIGLFALPVGILADRVIGRLLVVGCLVGMRTSIALVAAAPSLPVLALALFAWGLSASLYHPAALTLLSRATHARGRAFVLHGMAGNIGVATGPLLAAVMLGLLDWRLVALVLVAPVLIALVVALRLEFDEDAGMRARTDGDVGGDADIHSLWDFLARSKLLFAGRFVVVFSVAILYGLYYRGATTFLPDILAALPLFEPVVVSGRTLEPSRYVYAGLLLLGGAGQYAGGRLVDAIRTEMALVIGYGGLAVIAVLFIPLTAAGLLPLLVGAGVLGFSVFTIAPINQEAISAYSPADLRGLSFGDNYTGIFGVGALGATMAGAILTRSTPAILFLVLAGIAVLAVLLSALLFGSWRRL